RPAARCATPRPPYPPVAWHSVARGRYRRTPPPAIPLTALRPFPLPSWWPPLCLHLDLLFGQVVVITIAQHFLVDLAGGRQRDHVNDHFIGHPPFDDLVFQVRQHGRRGYLGTGMRFDDQQRPFLPLGMVDPDHGGQAYAGAGHRRVFDIDGTDPLPTGLDHILGAVGDA